MAQFGIINKEAAFNALGGGQAIVATDGSEAYNERYGGNDHSRGGQGGGGGMLFFESPPTHAQEYVNARY
jgi:hypothetical protein